MRTHTRCSPGPGSQVLRPERPSPARWFLAAPQVSCILYVTNHQPPTTSHQPPPLQVPVHCIGLQAYLTPNIINMEMVALRLHKLAQLPGITLYLSEFQFPGD